eukprot:CAMPEP_0114287136 /NCGR_PEP_ID=MMETSP0059-20121206/6122_1 /TAXON_ID=36894 /ORGANISM="Pyramimonas parkeae, Strain CCMP726" /LENGTH=339 /DNA_ID=CAMNT_0001408207 /DNA_START=385 /DNA_END=1404 /DNA_ORIENTATION=+
MESKLGSHGANAGCGVLIFVGVVIAALFGFVVGYLIFNTRRSPSLLAPPALPSSKYPLADAPPRPFSPKESIAPPELQSPGKPSVVPPSAPLPSIFPYTPPSAPETPSVLGIPPQSPEPSPALVVPNSTNPQVPPEPPTVPPPSVPSPPPLPPHPPGPPPDQPPPPPPIISCYVANDAVKCDVYKSPPSPPSPPPWPVAPPGPPFPPAFPPWNQPAVNMPPWPPIDVTIQKAHGDDPAQAFPNMEAWMLGIFGVVCVSVVAVTHPQSGFQKRFPSRINQPSENTHLLLNFAGEEPLSMKSTPRSCVESSDDMAVAGEEPLSMKSTPRSCVESSDDMAVV